MGLGVGLGFGLGPLGHRAIERLGVELWRLELLRERGDLRLQGWG